MDLDELHRQAVSQWCARVEAVGEADWSRPTPCADWYVRALVNHVVGEDLWTRPIVEGRRIEEVGDRYDGDVPLARTGPFGYTVRVVPRHELLSGPAALGLVATASA